MIDVSQNLVMCGVIRVLRYNMPRLPFNPEPLLAFFMTKKNAGSVAGDFEERFQR
jgi:hypothetical protein